MNTITKLGKKSAALLLMSALALSMGGFTPQAASAAVIWDVSGDWVIDMNYLGTDYAHDVSLVQDEDGNLTGSGGSPAGANVYTWEVTSGSVDEDSIEFDANYTATADAVTPQTVLHVEGTIAEDGSISGTWSDNYQGGDRSGTWESSSGAAVEIDAELPETVTVSIHKYVDGEMATSESADGASFRMDASWDAQNIGSSSGQFDLDADGFNGGEPYTATTSEMTVLADYSVSEPLNETTGESCDAETPFALQGYSWGETLAEAEDAEMSEEAPDFTDLTSDMHVIVWNDNCATLGDGTDGDLDGDVVGAEGELEVTSIETLDGTAVADGTYENGWKYRFNITVPTDEAGLAMKFSNWVNDSDAGETIPVANNMRISSEQDDAAGTVTISAADTYSIPNLDMEDDLDPEEDGIQVQVLVEVKVPVGTDNGSYSTNYGVRTE